jgi:hypothetical protein
MIFHRFIGYNTVVVLCIVEEMEPCWAPGNKNGIKQNLLVDVVNVNGVPILLMQ